MTIETIRASVKRTTARSAWMKGVLEYADELLYSLEEDINCGWFSTENLSDSALLERQMLNGARDWNQYSWGSTAGGGSSLIYNGDIADRLCTASELKKTRNGERKPNAREDWPDVQARALFQAARLILATVAK